MLHAEEIKVLDPHPLFSKRYVFPNSSVAWTLVALSWSWSNSSKDANRASRNYFAIQSFLKEDYLQIFRHIFCKKI